ncbi:hypothetical protein DAI22_07g092250 [Oryza sativa Japonica Group]|nr:uncharacterized protein LOC107281501 [Oryza sativa Japonica Group]KAF2922172.1 hypothetical protein DAI22_07g092250 [Oryza sativa Japonica Group]
MPASAIGSSAQRLPIAAVDSTLFPTSSAASPSPPPPVPASTSSSDIKEVPLFSLVCHYRFCYNRPTLLSIYRDGDLKKHRTTFSLPLSILLQSTYVVEHLPRWRSKKTSYHSQNRKGY